MDILVADEASFVDLRQRLIDAIKATEEIVQEIKGPYMANSRRNAMINLSENLAK